MTNCTICKGRGCFSQVTCDHCDGTGKIPVIHYRYYSKREKGRFGMWEKNYLRIWGPKEIMGRLRDPYKRFNRKEGCWEFPNNYMVGEKHLKMLRKLGCKCVIKKPVTKSNTMSLYECVVDCGGKRQVKNTLAKSQEEAKELMTKEGYNVREVKRSMAAI